MEAECGFEVGAPRVVNEGGKVLEVECDLYGPRTISCNKRCAEGADRKFRCCVEW